MASDSSQPNMAETADRLDTGHDHASWSAPLGTAVPRHPDCVSYTEAEPEISSSSKIGWGGPRQNAGGARLNSGGIRPNAGGARANSGGCRPGAGRKPSCQPAPTSSPTAKPLGPRWYCVQTWRRAERLVASEIARRGLTVHLPEYARIIGDGLIQLVPLFPGYLFVRFDVDNDPWRSITRDTPGVMCLFSVNERPIPLRTGEVERLIDAAGPDGAVERDVDPNRPLPVGTMVRIEDGPFGCFLGVVEACDTSTVRVLLMVFGRNTIATLPRRSVSAI